MRVMFSRLDPVPQMTRRQCDGKVGLGWNSDLQFIGHLSLGKILNCSVPLFPHLQNADDIAIYFI